MAFQLWCMMMGLVLFTLGFIWLIQIFLLEQNYAEAALTDTQDRLRPILEELKNGNIADDDRLLPFLSRISNGVLYLVDQDGELITIYTYGHKVDADSIAQNQDSPDVDDAELMLWNDIRSGKQYQSILDREPYQLAIQSGGRAAAVQLGIPITYYGQDSYLVVHHALVLDTLLNLNRHQLVVLSIFLTLAASILAAVFSRRFTRPIYAIKGAIDRLSENDFTARPDFISSDEFGQLAESVDMLGQALNRVDVLRKEVIANVSHELKSPLSVISGYAEMIRDIDWKDDEKRDEDLNLIISESHRMTEMVNDILDYSQLQSGYIRLNLESCSLSELVASEVDRCTAAAAEHQIHLKFLGNIPDLTIQVDPLKLSQVLRNLLNNAINHTPDGGFIIIELTSMGKKYRLEVKNPGEPIPEEDRKLIWERYQRSQHHSGRYLGTGIGLSIVRTILEAHGMSYGVDCSDGQTIFWFEGQIQPADA